MAKALDVPYSHLVSVAAALNGRKVDGISVNDLIGRYGFYSTFDVKNRVQVAAKYSTNSETVDVAFSKLKVIAKSGDPVDGYTDYIKGVKAEKEKDLRDHVEFGG